MDRVNVCVTTQILKKTIYKKIDTHETSVMKRFGMKIKAFTRIRA